MKNIILLLAIAVFVKFIFCSESILSKFHQNSFKLKDVRMQMMSYDKDYVKFLQITPFKYNRTTTAHNGSVAVHFDAEDKIEVLVQAYKFLSNEYRHFPLRFLLNAQRSYDTNAMGLASLGQCGNMTSFRFKKDVLYYTCNFVIDETHFPPMIPNGKYKLQLTITYLNKGIAVIDIYNEVYTPIEYPKN